MNAPKKDAPKTTRKTNPKLGYFGFLGILGFAGIYTYRLDKTVFPFLFFIFFGFFGFYFEGKMSNTFIDERWLQNKNNAERKAYKIGFLFAFLVLISSSWGWLWKTNDIKLIFLTISFSLAFALTIFLKGYLLYCLDHDEKAEDL